MGDADVCSGLVLDEAATIVRLYDVSGMSE